MVSKKVKVVNPSGLHLRPAGVLSQTAMKFKSRTLIECGEKHIVAMTRAKTRLHVYAVRERYHKKAEVSRFVWEYLGRDGDSR